MIHAFASRLLVPVLSGLVLASALPAQGGGATAKPAAIKKSAKAQKSEVPVQKAPAFPIAVVDIGLASTHTKAMQKGLEELQKMHSAFKRTLDGYTKEIETLRVEISMMKITTDEKIELQIELSAKVQRRDTAKERYDAVLNLRRGKMDAAVYREIEAALAGLSKAKGILLVLRKRTHQTVKEIVKKGGTPADATKRQISNDRLRNVLYNARAIDMTEDLIKYLKG